MLAVFFTLVFFAGWSAVGIAGLHLLRADLRDLRVALSAPMFGSALLVLPLFMLSNFGVPMRLGGPPVIGVFVIASIAVLALRRPRIALAVVPVIALCLVDVVLVGRPMFDLGLRWLADANGDMGYYVLSATELMNHGLRTAIDVHALAQNRDFPTASQELNLAGLRPGTQITLAAVAPVWNRHPVELYMPMAFSLNMGVICAVGALTMQASRRWWGALVAAALVVVSPLWGYGLMQQLLPQVWGVGLAVALFAWLGRAEVHKRVAPIVPDLFVIVVLAAATFIVYFEVAVSLIVAYGLYVVVLLVRRELSLRAVAVLWSVPIAATVAMTNVWLPKAFGYLHTVVSFGTTGGQGHGGASIFGYAMVPTALVGITGLRQIYAAPGDPHMSLFVAASALLLLGALAACVVIVRKAAAAGVVLLGDLVVGLLLARNDNEFGLFKLYMYLQPFLAATIAVWLSTVKSRRVFLAAGALLVAVVAVQITALTSYVDNSFNPIDLPHASASDVLPKFRTTLDGTTRPVVTVTDNFALLELQAAIADKRTLYFLSRNLFSKSWHRRTLLVPSSPAAVKLSFQSNRATSDVLNRADCSIVFPTGSQLAINRRVMPEGSPNYDVLNCGTNRNYLAFVNSSLGQPATLPFFRRLVSFWQLEPDPSFAGRTFAGFGRYALFQILGRKPRRVRVVLDLTSTPLSTDLPRARIVGQDEGRFPITGSGSARVVSSPVRPVLVDGRPYIVLDMGRNGRYPPVTRPGLTGLWGKSVRLDTRRLTSYIRDVSLAPVSASGNGHTPALIHAFPGDLGNPGLEYSGIYEDGWLSNDAYVILAPGGRRTLAIHGDALPLPGQRVELLVDGKLVASRAVSGGPLDWEVAVPPSSSDRRRVELRWAKSAPIGPHDPRRAVALVSSVGFTSAPTRLARFPEDLHRAGVSSTGVYDDGWLARVARLTVAGGPAAELVITAQVPEARGQRLVVRVDGRQVAARNVSGGPFTLRVPIAASPGDRSVELAWNETTKLAPPDTRRAAARLELLEVGRRFG
jgi:hypothetical protein